MRKLFTSLALCLFISACVSKSDVTLKVEQAKMAEQGPTIRGALSGQRQQIFSVYNNANDCSTTGYPTMKVAKPPQHGQVSVEQGSAIAAYPKTDIRNICNGKSVPATVIYYTSEPGFIGTDSVAFDRIGTTGSYGYHEFQIMVR